MPTFTATEIAFLMVACQQAVLALGWAIGAVVVPIDRRSALQWACYALLTGSSVLIFIAASQTRSEELRALANLCVATGIVLMERGVRQFTGRPAPWWPYALLVVGVAGLSWLGLDPGYGALRVAIVSGLVALLCALTAWNIYVYARRDLGLAFGHLLAVPLLLGAMVFATRSARAVVSPYTVVAELAGNSSLNIGSAVVFLVTALVFHLALVALVGMRLMAELRRLSRTDGLTEVFNRRAIEEQLHDEARRAVRSQRPFSVLMIDADYFKGINDRFGHAAGDDALRHLTRIMKAQMRDVDRIGRFGGEEFVAVLPGTAATEALNAAERLRDAVLRRPWAWQGEVLPLTVSIGVAAWRGPQDEVPALLKRADAALYRAKALGRDRFELGS
ncbi:GGDEF domain-containing protein [Piscinibacter sp. HJYY11]|uniref:GGDEF domain-containing protein n=1 Tax=Piscinibacter sp. HJYY11 TaxID=2801333 RepID=UPI0019202C3C|nr:GGDEF domain-containing protein [Piscinibacter sp. HJYY11]MBL0730405.1 GGDEF domain-containing protein [Piscinibacter sp. HJYY11]